MSDGVRPVGPASPDDRRARDRRSEQRRAGSTSRALIPLEQPGEDSPAKPAASPPAADSAAAFAAQMLGQSGQKRGLKGGPPVLDAARSTYLGAEYSGAAERRPPVGKAKSTDV
ncbi:hypothetical protein GVN24_32735 [Rhizobium sp. CRIBSB]|nr:hypothetical protein [Rhizobium sp. CRIBSB]